MLEIKTHGHVVYLVGGLIETANIEVLDKALQKASLADESCIKIDLGAMTSLNSIGQMTLFKTLRKVNKQITLAKCPVFFVESLNVTASFFAAQNIVVESFEAPFFHEETAEVITTMLHIGDDIPLQASYEDYLASPIERDGKVYIPDFNADFLYFLEQFNLAANSKVS